MTRRGFVVQQAAVGHGQHAGGGINRKPASRCIPQAIGLRIPRIHVGPAHRPYHRAGGRVLGHRVRREAQVTRDFVHVTQINRKRLGVALAAAIRHLHRHRMARRGFIVQQGAIGHGQYASGRINRKPPSRRICQAIGLRIPRIHVGPTHGPHHGARTRVLHHAVRRQCQVRGPLISICHRDSNGLGVGSAIPIGHLYRHIIDIVTTTIRW